MKTAITALLALLLTACAGTSSAPQPAAGPTLDEAIAAAHRTPAYRERDRYRHPKETLEFFGVKPGLVVVEVWPSRGWYTEILAPYLRGRGTYYAAGFPISNPDIPEYQRRITADFAAKLAGAPELYSEVTVSELGAPDRWTACPPGTADLVLTFRNVHNWMVDDSELQMFKAFHAALKPGGTLGVVEHRAKPGTSREQMIKSGYVTEAHVIAIADKAGFKLVKSSEVNANPKDTKDHPEGVWTLPPSLALKDKDREKYLAIGESDRMTLKFAKR